MARTQSISEADLIGRLSLVFRDRGYEGAALADLASAAGLKKASLYHRFPGGKQQMAEEVMAAAIASKAALIVGAKGLAPASGALSMLRRQARRPPS
jgi:TetR/AcrR family transcriptional regulator, lmrAB and yxaGH operons repressor